MQLNYNSEPLSRHTQTPSILEKEENRKINYTLHVPLETTSSPIIAEVSVIRVSIVSSCAANQGELIPGWSSVIHRSGATFLDVRPRNKSVSIQLSFRAYPPKKNTDGFAICARHFACCCMCVRSSSSTEEGRDVPAPNPSGRMCYIATPARINVSTNTGKGCVCVASRRHPRFSLWHL